MPVRVYNTVDQHPNQGRVECSFTIRRVRLKEVERRMREKGDYAVDTGVVEKIWFEGEREGPQRDEPSFAVTDRTKASYILS